MLKTWMTTGDKVIFFLVIVLSLFSMFGSFLWFSGQEATLAVVEVNGKLYGEYSLQEKSGKTLEITTEFGYNKIEIENGSLWVSASSCPDGLEIKSGKISKSGEMLVCLPNRLVVFIRGEREVDGVAY